MAHSIHFPQLWIPIILFYKLTNSMYTQNHPMAIIQVNMHVNALGAISKGTQPVKTFLQPNIPILNWECQLTCIMTIFIHTKQVMTVSRPTSAVYVSSEHWTTSCIYRMHCTVFIRSYCSLFAAFSTHICLFTHGANCSNSSRHCYYYF